MGQRQHVCTVWPRAQLCKPRLHGGMCARPWRVLWQALLAEGSCLHLWTGAFVLLAHADQSTPWHILVLCEEMGVMVEPPGDSVAASGAE
jgi:hypothetical protein